MTAAGLAGEGERVAAVMTAAPTGAGTFYLVAFESAAGHSYAVLDDSGEIVRDRRVVGDVVTVIGLAELAEEVSAATAAEQLEQLFTDLAETLDGLDAQAAAGARQVAQAAVGLGQVAAGPRAASPAYLDRLAAAAEPLAVALDQFEAEAQRLAQAAGAEPALADAASAAWQALAVASRCGDPAGFGQAMSAAGGSLEALVDEVLEHHRVALT